MRLILPAVHAVDEWRAKNRVRQLGASSSTVEGVVATFSRGRVAGHLFQSDVGDPVLIIPHPKTTPASHDWVIDGTLDPAAADQDLSGARWLKHPVRRTANALSDAEENIRAVLESWEGAFSFALEDVQRCRIGLRPPQVGAVHAVHAHWMVSNDVATIVMPTGTGKTDTMLSILVSGSCAKVLVIVPTDALRAQLTEKFLTLGVLKAAGSGVLVSRARWPLVCTLLHIPRDIAEVDNVFSVAQVLVTTSAIAAHASEEVQQRMAFHCTHLFIDEAHHAEARTWAAFKSSFRARRILQFTATPFREDGRPLDGKIIFKYPLRRAQEEGYFKPIRFRQVAEFDSITADKKIAEAAVEQLRADAEKRHVLMARVDSVARAEEVFKLYAPYSEFKPVQLHSGVKSKQEREETREQIVSGASRIVVCVDMLGEGFDLPELKIAAFHDIRKSLAVTLQLAGRFTRSRPDLGDATFIANTADIHVHEELRKLYSQDPDWNVLLPDLSDRLIGEQVSLQEYLAGFTELADEVPLKAVRPATSTVVYRTSCAFWHPDKFRSGIPGIDACEQVHHAVNEAKKTLIVVTARRARVPWTEAETLFTLDWELYVVIWYAEQALLFINASENAGEYRTLARAVAGEDATLVNGDIVFRAFAGITRLQLQNVGLTEQLGRNVRYTGRMGSDVEAGVTEIQRRTARKSVLSGVGFESGRKVTVGASRKGRIWSHRRERIDELSAWCQRIGGKLLDESIDPEAVLKGTLEGRRLTVRPPKIPLTVDWPEEIYRLPERRWIFELGGRAFGLDDVDLDLTLDQHEPGGPLSFTLRCEDRNVIFSLTLFEVNENPDYRFEASEQILIRRGEGASAEPVVDFFGENPPVIWFVDGSSLEGNDYVELKGERPPYDASKVVAWNWHGVDIRKESQGAAKASDSVQRRVINELKTRSYDIIVDDDRRGEAADVVAIRLAKADDARPFIEVEFYHCKYSSGAAAGARVADLYEVCGQAQKSVCWMSSGMKRTDLFTHLLRRAAASNDTGWNRYELGDAHRLQEIREMTHLYEMRLAIFIVQPGVSKAKLSSSMLELLAVTETYLLETYQLPFGVITSS